jgi:hypothetical protein
MEHSLHDEMTCLSRRAVRERNFLPGYVTVTLKLDFLLIESKLNYFQSQFLVFVDLLSKSIL